MYHLFYKIQSVNKIHFYLFFNIEKKKELKEYEKKNKLINFVINLSFFFLKKLI